jgi:hypothetical protein
MTIIRGSRTQINLFPSSIDDFLSIDNTVRVYDAFIDAIKHEDLALDTDQKY